MLEAVDPAWRLAGAISLAVGMTAIQTSRGLVAAALGLMILLVVARPPGIVRRLLLLNGLLLGLFVVMIVGGDSNWRSALLLVGKVNVIFACLQGLVSSLTGAELAVGVQRLRLPAKLVTMLVLMVRYVELLKMEHQRLWTSMRLRGFQARCDMHSLRCLGYLVGMLLWRGLKRAERVYWAMKCRGFQGRFPVVVQRWQALPNLLFAAGVASWLTGILWLEYR